MKRSITRWTTAVATAALLAVPAAVAAQTGATPPQQTTTSPAEAQNAGTPQEHLRKAKAALESIDPTAVTGPAKSQVAEVKRHLNALERAAGSTSNASATGAAQQNPRATAARGNASWSTEVAAIDSLLASLLGAGTTGATGTTGTTGTTGSASVTIDEATRAALMDVRRHVTSFAAAMSGTASTSPADQTQTAATTSATGSTTTPTNPTDPQPPTGTQTGATGAEQPDADAARRHLTEARDTLSQLTQLPAAAQLSGEARTQVSQLISNFNELITAQADWRASFTKVEANLDSLLGPDDPTMTGSTTATGTAGAVGTSGAGAASVNLDPAIREKLVALRAKLNEFERVAGGSAASSNPATSDTTAMSSQHAQMGHSEAMRHIEAIEAILNANSAASATGTTGTSPTNPPSTTAATTSAAGAAGTSLTLTSAQLDQLRTHLSELKKLVSEARK